MKQLYDHTGKYMIRIPIGKKMEKIVHTRLTKTNSFLTELCCEPLFREQILVSSKTLYDTMDTFITSPEKLTGKKKRNFINSISKYYWRRCTRTTPFGLFSSVGQGCFTHGNKLVFDQSKFYKRARVDIEWLFNIIKRMEKESPEYLTFKSNHACYVKGDRAYLPYSTGGQPAEISIRATPVFKLLYNSCHEFIRFSEIVEILEGHYPETSKQRIESYLKELIRKEFLISSLRPPLIILDQYQFFIDQIEDSVADFELLTKLKDIQNQIDVY